MKFLTTGSLPLLLVVFFSGAEAHAFVEGQLLTKQGGRYSPGRRVVYLEDAGGEKELRELRFFNADLNFNPVKTEIPNFGYTSSAYWFTFGLNNVNTIVNRWMLEIGYPPLDEVDVYYIFEDGSTHHYATGDYFSFSARPVVHRNYIFPFELARGETVQVWVRVRTTSFMQVPMVVWSEAKFLSAEVSWATGQGLYYGILLILAFYNLFVYYSVRSVSFLSFSLMVFSLVGFQASADGLTYQYLWPSLPWLEDRAGMMFLSSTLFFSSYFSILYLRLSEAFAKVNLTIMGFGFGGAVIGVCGLVFDSSLATPPLALFSYILGIACLAGGVLRWVEGAVDARVYVVAWFCLLFGFLFQFFSNFVTFPDSILGSYGLDFGPFVFGIFRTLGLSPGGGVTETVGLLGCTAGVLLLSLGLGRQLREDQDALLESERKTSESLKVRMDQRTENFHAAAADARAAMAEAKRLEEEIIHLRSEAIELRGEIVNIAEHTIREVVTLTDSELSARHRLVDLDSLNEVEPGEEGEGEERAEARESLELQRLKSEALLLEKSMQLRSMQFEESIGTRDAPVVKAPSGGEEPSVAPPAMPAPDPEEESPNHPRASEPPVAAPVVSPLLEQRSQKGSLELNRLLTEVSKKGASDLHLSGGQSPRYRLHGDIFGMSEVEAFKENEVYELVESIMSRASLDEFLKMNDCDFGYTLKGVARFRVNVFRDRLGISAVFRIIPTTIKTIEELGLPASISKVCDYAKGLVLITGPTGSGKSTTVAALIDEINATKNLHILTLEEPIEFVHRSKKALVNQREIGPHAMSFGRALRAGLREDPDVVVVGELRDLEAIQLAIEVANTGHLVLGTLHTSSAASTIDRVVDVFAADKQAQIRAGLSESLRAVVCQVLCRSRRGGRIPAIEVLICNNAVGSLIREGKTHQIANVMVTGRSLGNQTLNQSLKSLVDQGLIDREEALKKTSEREALSRLLDG